MARPHLHLVKGRTSLWRLADDEFVTLGHHALPLRQNFELLLRLSQRSLPGGVPLTLGHALAVLELRFGPSSPLFDPQHGSFSFPLLITNQRKRRVSVLLRCHDYRGDLYFPLYRVTAGDPSLHERAHCHVPRADDLSQADIDEFIMTFHSYLLEQATFRETGLAASFYRAIPSDMILYGFDGVRFFEHRYGHWFDYERTRQELEFSLGPRRPRSNSDRVERLIDEVTEL
jgi:hypothetical protein